MFHLLRMSPVATPLSTVLRPSFFHTTFGETYGRDSDPGHSVRRTRDDGCVIAMKTQSSYAGDGDVSLVKSDENGLTGIEETGTRHLVPRGRCALFDNCPDPFDRPIVIFYLLQLGVLVTLDVCGAGGLAPETLESETGQSGIYRVRHDHRFNSLGVCLHTEPGEGQSLRPGEFEETGKMLAAI